MKWSYRLVKIGKKYHICEVYVGRSGEPSLNSYFAIEDSLGTGEKLPQWIIKDLFQKPLEYKNNKIKPYELRHKKS